MSNDIENCRYALPEHSEPKRIGDMDRSELLRVIAGLIGQAKWWKRQAIRGSE